MKKRILGIILTLVMLCSICTVATAENTPSEPIAISAFSDVAGLPYEDAINYLAQNGIVNGRKEGVFAPNENLTRAEIVTIILRGFGSKEIEDIEKFRDVPPTHWAYMYVETAYKMGIVNGMTATTFVPDGLVTYEQAVKMLVCAIGKGSQAEKEGGWPNGYIAVAEELGTLNEVKREIGETITRGEMAQLVYNFLAIKEDEFAYMYDWNNGTVAEHYNWIRDEKLRGAYDAIVQIKEPNLYMKRLNDLGVNTFFLNLHGAGYEYKTYEGAVKLLEDGEEWLKNYNCHPFVKINYGDNGYCANADYRAFHPGVYRESYHDIVCPLQPEYWDKQLLERCIEIAKRPVYEGIVLDFEMYHGVSGYPSNCMCDSCWKNYIKDKKLGKEWESIEVTKRTEYLNSKKRFEDYNDWVYEQIVALCSSLVERVHEVNPEIIFAYMPGYEWLKGMTEGLGTPERPVLVLSEGEYWGSLASSVGKMQNIKDSGYHALYVPGLYPGKTALSPSELEKNIGLVSTTTPGYWIYGSPNCDNDEEYYNGVERANNLLIERTQSGELVPFPTYEVHSYSAKKIKGDTPTDEEWNSAPLTEEFVYYKKPEENKALVKTYGKILYSDTDIFVKVIAYGDTKEIVIKDKQERDQDIWNGPNVEVFWRFDDRTDIMHIGANPAGSIWDSYATGIGSQNSAIDFDAIESNTVIYEDRWETVLKIPGTMDGIRTIKKGDVLRLEVSRYHLPSIEAGNTGYLVWTPTYSSFLGTSALWGIVNLD